MRILSTARAPRVQQAVASTWRPPRYRRLPSLLHAVRVDLLQFELAKDDTLQVLVLFREFALTLARRQSIVGALAAMLHVDSGSCVSSHSHGVLLYVLRRDGLLDESRHLALGLGPLTVNVAHVHS